MKDQKLCDLIALFYKLHHEKGKSYTFIHFKNSGLSKAGIYKIMQRFDEGRNVDRKAGSGRPKRLSKKEKGRLIKDVNHNIICNHFKQIKPGETY